MPSPFPGMDPFLERRVFWPAFHTNLINALNVSINAALPRRFVSKTEVRVYIEDAGGRDDIPDVAVFSRARNAPGSAPDRVATLPASVDMPEEIPLPLEAVEEPFLEIKDRQTDMKTVMIVEVLSPANKARGRGHEEYRAKQRRTLLSDTHLLELDLLRTGLHTVAAPEAEVRARGPFDYLFCLRDAHAVGSTFVWRLSLRERLPSLLLPLTADAEPFRLDVQAAFTRCYEENRYEDLFAEEYAGPPETALGDADAAWADALLREKGFR